MLDIKMSSNQIGTIQDVNKTKRNKIIYYKQPCLIEFGSFLS